MVSKEKILITTALSLALLSLVFLDSADSRMAYYSFNMDVPDHVRTIPGEDVIVNGSILVTGHYWLHNFELTVDGLEYDYELNPTEWRHVKILREWNSEQGVHRIPEDFEISIDIPENASGVHLVTITGQEHHSWREVSNETSFLLIIGGEEDEHQIDMTDIEVPEKIKESELFNINFKLENKVDRARKVEVSLNIPDTWKADDLSKMYTVEGKSNESGSFNIIPSNESGELSLNIKYPFKDNVVNFTKEGPYLVPVDVDDNDGYSGIIGNFIYRIRDVISIPDLGEIGGSYGDYRRPAIFSIGTLLSLIIIWLAVSIIRDVRSMLNNTSEDIEGVTLREV